MSDYDMLPKGSQVKCWVCEYRTYHVGDSVFPFYPLGAIGCSDYVVLLSEGGYVRVKEGVITKIVENHGQKAYYPEDFDVVCIDKWGGVVKNKQALRGLLGSNYYWWSSANK